MAFVTVADLPWHAGEERMHKLLHVPDNDNPTSSSLTPGAANLLMRSPLLSIGTLDSEGWPWTTVLGGEAGLSQPLNSSVIGIKAVVDKNYDPVLRAMFQGKINGEVVQEQGMGRMVSGLAIDLENRKRVKVYGRMIAGALGSPDDSQDSFGDVQLAVRVEQSLGNCPKYLNKKHIYSVSPVPVLISESKQLPQRALDLLAKVDLFFISSSNHDCDMDTNHRGGPPGFVRVLSNDLDGTAIVYPEYSGNRLYQTLGNLQTTPKAGLTFPDFDTGDVLYVSGDTEVLVGRDADRLLPHANLAVKISIKRARFVEKGLAFRGTPGEPSPYNPRVRYLVNEPQANISDLSSASSTSVRLTKREIITPTIARFTFENIDPAIVSSGWKAGQYVALGFENELGHGYSHMRDYDPRSLNDDYLRTFTVSSQPPDEGKKFERFEITIRKVGVVTDYLFNLQIRNELEVQLRGFGGEFIFRQDAGKGIGFIAGGIGITPILAQSSSLDRSSLRIFWTVSINDIKIVLDTFERHPGLKQCTHVFITGTREASKKDREEVNRIRSMTQVFERRLSKSDLDVAEEVGAWYLCAGPAFRKSVLEWLKGKNVQFEDFGY
ncbi:MAG: hypothetical protein M1834_005698 [Cirrosporium novae-zelandiae]|nr:MAG: hypothetical protein M1834_005698 [Cirrosporium novae-zelandiae]